MAGPGASLPFSATTSSAKLFQLASSSVTGPSPCCNIAAMDDSRTKFLTDGSLAADSRMLRVPLTAALMMGSGSVKKNDTGDARCAIAVDTLDSRVKGALGGDVWDLDDFERVAVLRERGHEAIGTLQRPDSTADTVTTLQKGFDGAAGNVAVGPGNKNESLAHGECVLGFVMEGSDSRRSEQGGS